MRNINITTPNTTFNGRNQNLRQAELILRKINNDFPSVSPWHADYRAAKRNKINPESVSTKWATAKLNVFRDAQESVVDKSYSKYISCLIEGIRHYKVANCKELAELAYIIAKTNGVEDCYCANLYLKNYQYKNNSDLDHSIFIINPQAPDKAKLADPYYDEKPSHSDLFEPNPKSIVIDATFGFVDFWKNVKNIYKNMGFVNPGTYEDLTVNLKKPLFKDANDIQKTQINYPILALNGKNSKSKLKYDFRASDIALEIYKSSTKNLVVNDYPSAFKSKKSNSHQKKKTIIDKFKDIILK